MSIKKSVPASSLPAPVLVTRSKVPPAKNYGEYREYLRHDFFNSCAYCTLSEHEARGVRFTIDHYEPQKARADLVNDYGNLLYSCDSCNILKGNRNPPESARAAGQKFFRPDNETFPDTFELDGRRVKGRTPTGEFTIEAVELNRAALQRLRDLRRRLAKCDEMVAHGVFGLRGFPIDQLPKEVKGIAMTRISRAVKTSDEIVDEVESVLRDYARSELLDVDPDDKEYKKRRSDYFKQIEALHPGDWRAYEKRKK